MVLGHRLKLERDKHGWSQKYIAEKTGIPSSNISRYETGERKPDIETLVTLADFIGCSVDYLLCRSDVPAMSRVNETEDLEDLLYRNQCKLCFRDIPLKKDDIKDLITIMGILISR